MIYLSRELAAERLWPAIDLTRSRTKNDELIHSYEAMEAAQQIREELEGDSPSVAMQRVLDTLRAHEDNISLIASI